MKILSVDTSTLVCGAAFLDSESGLSGEISLSLPSFKKRSHSELLIPLIDNLLSLSDFEVKDMDVFAITTGPGSFSGIRAGLSTIKGFAFATGRSVVPVSALESVTWNFPCSSYPVLTLMEASKGEVYHALYTWEEGDFKCLSEVDADRIEDVIGKIREKVIVAGNAAVTYRTLFAESKNNNIILAPSEKCAISPLNVAYIAARKAKRGETEDPVTLKPLYIKKARYRTMHNK